MIGGSSPVRTIAPIMHDRPAIAVAITRSRLQPSALLGTGNENAVPVLMIFLLSALFHGDPGKWWRCLEGTALKRFTYGHGGSIPVGAAGRFAHAQRNLSASGAGRSTGASP